ncbi:competence/damage-inducible protein A [Antarcticibacterium flavum]|uniref:CinA-like protein n=1 Tax=Antarcticibacterium flavum TaxID=2058175 RepID=A0A5B7X6I2_9FLAO|nr:MULTISPECIES: competence/damage-inducible protein A [Antarcticibacterium]MCM4159777.1 competence/damage-inducible protein A [Antarcticibacterium sp. W02-3]QCY70705.1 competence/damage-inducible protein A [Antarcticibacterium flavum]
MTAEIITIGDELLIGQVADTNSSDIAQKLDRIGISVNQILTIKDEKEPILNAMEQATGRANVVIITGGLGPTKDDVTKYSFCEFFEDTLVNNEKVLHHIEELFKKIKNTPISDLNREQAMVPSRARVLHNKYGTAPGLWMEKKGTVFVALPGVPFEMQMLMNREVIPALKEKFNRPYIYHKTVRTFGLGESAVAQRLEEWEDNLPTHLKLAYLPDLGSVRLRLSGKGENEEELKSLVEEQLDTLYPLIEDIMSNKVQEDDDITVTISKLLLEREQFLAAAESCTGGHLAAQFTTNPGASTCFKGGIVTYATRSKEEILNVPHEIIEEHSVVSSEVAKSMAKNARDLFKADYALATTGNAGPKKGESDAEVGTVYIGVATPQKVYSHKYVFGKTREQVVNKAVNKAFELILQELVKNSSSGKKDGGH